MRSISARRDSQLLRYWHLDMVAMATFPAILWIFKLKFSNNLSHICLSYCWKKYGNYISASFAFIKLFKKLIILCSICDVIVLPIYGNKATCSDYVQINSSGISEKLKTAISQEPLGIFPSNKDDSNQCAKFYKDSRKGTKNPKTLR